MIRHSREHPYPGVHVILGGSAGGIFTRNFSRKQLLVDPDVLSCGPTPACDSFNAWKTMRVDYWRNLVPGSVLEDWPDSHLGDHAGRLRDAEVIHVWAATGLTEQLFIAHVMHLIDTLGVDAGRVQVLQFENLRSRKARIIGMGELNEANMADHPEPVALTCETADDYRAAWTALTSSDPTLFEKFPVTRPNANGWLKQAMHLMLRRFPNRWCGVPHWDRVLLAKIREYAPRAHRAVAATMTDDWDDADLTGDFFLFGRLLKLGDERLPKPLLALNGDRTDMHKIEASLTPFGLDVLEGRASAFPTNPIEDWAAGVRLSSSQGNLWFNDGGKIVRWT